MPELLAHADSVSKLWAVCMKCGAPASKSHRLAQQGRQKNESQVLVGAASVYEARCRACHIEGMAEQQAAVDFLEHGL